MDLEKLRRDTPCKNIYWNHGSTSVPPRQVIAAVNEYFDITMRMGATSAPAEALTLSRYDEARLEVGRLIGAQADEILFMPNGSQAIGMVASGLPVGPGSNVVVDSLGFVSNIAPFLRLRQMYGTEIRFVGAADGEGFIDLDGMARAVDENTVLVAVTHSPNYLGVLQPLREIGQIARRYGALFLVNASNTVGIAPIDVGEIGCDFLSASGRKYLRGPGGSGFLYAKADAVRRISPPFFTWNSGTWNYAEGTFTPHPDINRLAYGERDYPAIFGLWRAVRYLSEIGGQAAVRARTNALLQRLIDGVREIPDVEMYGPQSVDRRAGVIGINIRNVPFQKVTRFLNANNVGVMGHSFFCFGLRDALHIDGATRLSLHCWNTEEEVDFVLKLLRDPGLRAH